MNNIEMVMNLGNKVLAGQYITKEDAMALADISQQDLLFLLAMADKIRQRYVGDEVDLCAIINGRSGKCPENCRFCAQSVYHQTDIATYGLKTSQELVAAARQAEKAGARRFAIVTSGRGMTGDNDFVNILTAIKSIRQETKLKICASLGILSSDNARELVAAGVTRYHHNVETSRSYYPKICTSHTYDDKMGTIAIAHQAGLEVCSGGIIGLGESMENRIEMAFELKALQVKSVPINILNPIPGTPLAENPPLAPQEILKTFAIFRFILPQCELRTAGGRELNLRDLQSVALMSGMNGMMIGGYLTTDGREAAKDLQMIKDLARSLPVKED